MISTRTIGQVAECDGCGQKRYAVENTEDFIKFLKSIGWKFDPPEEWNDWLHYCPDCQEAG